MKIEKTTSEGFKPYKIIFTVETEEEHEMLDLLCSYSISIPRLMDVSEGKIYRTTESFLLSLYNKINN